MIARSARWPTGTAPEAPTPKIEAIWISGGEVDDRFPALAHTEPPNGEVTAIFVEASSGGCREPCSAPRQDLRIRRRATAAFIQPA